VDGYAVQAVKRSAEYVARVLAPVERVDGNPVHPTIPGNASRLIQVKQP
jgi:hypothetical protein